MMTIGRINRFIGQGAGDTLVLISGRKKLDKAASLLRQANLACCSIVYIGIQKPDELAALAVIPSEDFLAKEDYQRIDEFVFGRLVGDWYAYKGITEYRGMALGKMLEYEFQSFLIPRIKNLELLRQISAKMLVRRIVVIEESGEMGSATLAYGKALGIPVLRVCLGKTRSIPVAIKEALGSLLSDLCDGLARRRLSVADKPAAGWVILDARLYKFFKAQDKDKVFLLSFFEKGLRVRLRLLAAGGTYLPFYARRHRRYQKEWLPYPRKWRELSGATNFRDIFVYEKIPFWGMVERKLKDFFRDNIPRVISNIHMLEALVEVKKINLAVMRNDVKETEMALVFALRLRGIPSLVVQHGVFADNKTKKLSADAFAAWGQASLDLYRGSADSCKRCVITGNPNFDFLLGWRPKVSRQELFGQLGLDENKGLVLLVTQQIHKLSAYLSDDLCLAMADRVLSAMRNFPDKQTVIKIDPYEDLSVYRRLVREKSFKGSAAVKDVDIFTLMYFCDAVIIFNSTAGLETMFFGKPLITVNLTKRQDTVGYAQKQAALEARNEEELLAALDRVFSDKKTNQYLEVARGHFLEEYAYRLDGRAVNRLLGLFGRMVSQRKIELADRQCDCCENTELEEVWRYEKEARTKQHTFTWQVRNVICKRCGFAFVSPVPTEGSLKDYYGDSYEYFRGIELDYSIEKRIGLIVRYLRGNHDARYVEVGGNENTRFLSELSRHVGSITSVELNLSCRSDHKSLEALKEGCADIISAYFVLEHMPDPKHFFHLCARRLRRDGILIIEVPDLSIYPFNPAGLALWEHTSHFSARSLSCLAQSQGFSLLEVSHQDCSRPFGFAAVFSNTGKIIAADLGVSDYQNASYCMREGIKKIEEHRRNLMRIREKIDAIAKNSGSAVIWAANKVCLELLEGYELPPAAVIVDSNPQKKNYLAPLEVRQPKEAFADIRNAGLLVINTKLHAREILGFIKENVGRTFGRDELIIVE
jgi:SAM-dependent methyltransferase